MEPACLTRHAGFYYLLVNCDACCRGVDSTCNTRVGRNRSVHGPDLDRDGKDLRQGDGSLVLATAGRFIGPGHAGLFPEGTNSWFSHHSYDGEDRGRPKLQLRKLAWVEDWPTVP